MKDVITYDSKRILGIISKDEYLHYYDNDTKKNGTVLIALHDPSHNFHPDSKIKGFDDVLQMKFWDIEEEFGNYKPITQEQADEIREFILRNEDKQFLIHCHAGISRSAGVGVAVERLLDNIRWENSEINWHTRYTPNKVVFEKITNGI